jgi:hypothetical protein
MRGPYLFPALQGQTVKALRICDPAPDGSLIRKQLENAHFGAVALECERHALLCYCPVRYLLYPHGSTFGCFGDRQAALPFRASVCEVFELENWLPITAGAHWSHHFDRELPMRGEVLKESPQLVRDTQTTDWQLELRLTTGRNFRLLQNKECNRLQFAPVKVGSLV